MNYRHPLEQDISNETYMQELRKATTPELRIDDLEACLLELTRLDIIIANHQLEQEAIATIARVANKLTLWKRR